jgi:hypothetical protein
MYAAVNLAAGIVLVFTQPSRADDVWIMYDWCRAWLLHGQQLYAGVEARTDYPPNAIVLLSPLALVPRAWIVPAWTAFTLTLTPLYAWLVVRANSPRLRAAAAVVPILLFLCWGGTRTFLEFSRLSITLAFAAVILADSRPVASGFALGFALMKPHIAGPILLWAIVTKRLRVVVIAAGVVAAGFTVYCLRAHVSPAIVVADYVQILRTLYSGEDPLMGRTSLQPWWRALAGDSTLGIVVWAVAAGLLLVVPCRMAMRPSATPEVRGSAVLALCCLWSLLTIYHIGNNLAVLMLPSFVFLWTLDDPATVRWRMSVVAAIQVALMLDVPVHVAPLVPDHGLAFMVVRDFDRLIVLLAFVAITVLSLRLTTAAVTPIPE